MGPRASAEVPAGSSVVLDMEGPVVEAEAREDEPRPNPASAASRPASGQANIYLEPGVYFFDGGLTVKGGLVGGNQAGQPVPARHPTVSTSGTSTPPPSNGNRPPRGFASAGPRGSHLRSELPSAIRVRQRDPHTWSSATGVDADCSNMKGNWLPSTWSVSTTTCYQPGICPNVLNAGQANIYLEPGARTHSAALAASIRSANSSMRRSISPLARPRGRRACRLPWHTAGPASRPRRQCRGSSRREQGWTARLDLTVEGVALTGEVAMAEGFHLGA